MFRADCGEPKGCAGRIEFETRCKPAVNRRASCEARNVPNVMFLTTSSLLTLILLGLLVVGSLLSLSNHPHWLIRGWDFPRVQIIVIGWTLACLYALLRYFASPGTGSASWTVPIWAVFVVAIVLTLWHGFLVLPYTQLMPKQSASTPRSLRHGHRVDPQTIRVVMSNVEMENTQHDRWMEAMRSVDPDVLLVLEPSAEWLSQIKTYTETFPYRVAKPQDNWYGMLLLSKLPIEDHEVRFLVQQDVPSIDARIRMHDGTRIRFVGVHPRPPEPIRGNDATARDAELTLWGRELEKSDMPVIIGGDLNDVAWSQTTRLFLRTSGLLDPRRGRGFYNTFHVDHLIMRFPLDHVFHSNEFTVSGIQRLDPVGSDHFPIMIDLRYTPSQKFSHEVMESKEADAEEIELRIQRATESDDFQGDAVKNEADAP